MSGLMKAAQFLPGGPENIYIGDVAIPALKQGEVLLQVHATAINRADTLQVHKPTDLEFLLLMFCIAALHVYK